MAHEEADGEHHLANVAYACGPADIALALSRLEANGLVVFPAFHYTVSNAWHWTLALGGVALKVPLSQVASAEALLGELRPITQRPGMLALTVCLLGFLVAWLPPPVSGLFPARSPVAAASRT